MDYGHRLPTDPLPPLKWSMCAPFRMPPEDDVTERGLGTLPRDEQHSSGTIAAVAEVRAGQGGGRQGGWGGRGGRAGGAASSMVM